MILFHTVLYGVLAGASALAAAAVVVVLRSGHARLHGIAFAIGFLAAQALVCLLALWLGDDSLPQSGSAHAVAAAIVQILLGVALLVAARRVRRPHPQPIVPREPGPLAQKLRARQTATLDRIGRLDTGPIVGAGALLGVGGPKRLLLTVLATAGIATAQVSRTGETSLVVVYVLLATALVWVPVLLAVVWGNRAGEWTATVQAWWKAHRATATFVPLIAFGAYFLVAGIVALFNS
jgi:hypothetical protein